MKNPSTPASNGQFHRLSSSVIDQSAAAVSVPQASATSAGIKVCITGANTSLKFGGESALPWFYFSYLRARGVDAHLVTHGCTLDELRLAFPDDLDRIHTVNDTRLDRFLFRLGRFLPGRIDDLTLTFFRAWVSQLRQKRILKQLVREGKIDIVHETTPVSPKQVSVFFGLGVPVVMGPLCGGVTYPPAFRFMQSRLTHGVEAAGRALAHVLNVFVPGKRQAEALIVANQLARASLPMGTKGRIYEMTDIGVDLSAWDVPDNDAESVKPRGEARFVYLGRLVEWKGGTFLLDAFASIAQRLPHISLDIIGDGPERKSLESQVQRLNIASRVIFHGHLFASASAALMRSADALVLPSLRECGGGVLLEAMALGLPVIATNWAGPSIHITDQTGIRVNPDSREAFVRGLADAMIRLAENPDLRKQMGNAGRKHVTDNCYDWNSKVDRVMEIYAEVLATKKHETGK